MDSEQSAMSEAPAPAPPPAAPRFIPLHPRVVHLWRFQHLISSFVLLAGCMVAVGITAVQYPPSLMWGVGAWVTLALLRAFLLFWYPYRAYRAWGYRVDGQVLETTQGIWFRTITLLPLSRLQHVDLQRGPLERMCGLASLTLYTAGTHHATVEIPGLDPEEAARLRDHLVALGAEQSNDGT